MPSEAVVNHYVRVVGCFECAVDLLDTLEYKVKCDHIGPLTTEVQEAAEIFFEHLLNSCQQVAILREPDDTVVTELANILDGSQQVEKYGFYRYDSNRCQRVALNFLDITMEGEEYNNGSPQTPSPANLYLSDLARSPITSLNIYWGTDPGVDTDLPPNQPNFTGIVLDKDQVYTAICQLRNHFQGIVKYSCLAVGKAKANDSCNKDQCAVLIGNTEHRHEMTEIDGLVERLDRCPVKIGHCAGFINQACTSVAVGCYAGFSNQFSNSVAIGSNAGKFTQSNNAVAIGHNAGYTDQDEYTVAVGYAAGSNNQGNSANAIGRLAGNCNQGNNAVAVGLQAGESNQGLNAVAIGVRAGQSNQQPYAVSIGYEAGLDPQSNHAIAIGTRAGASNQSSNAIALGQYGGRNSQSCNAIAIGQAAGSNGQGVASVAIGQHAGQSNQSNNAVAIGLFSGQTGQGVGSVALGVSSAQTGQPNGSVFIGSNAGGTGVGATNTTGNNLVIGGDIGFINSGSITDNSCFNSVCSIANAGDPSHSHVCTSTITFNCYVNLKMFDSTGAQKTVTIPIINVT